MIRMNPWALLAASMLALPAAAEPAGQQPLPWLEEIASPLDEPKVLDELTAAMGTRRLVLLGESTHGTHEYYTWRDRITRRLVADGGFRFVLVEGDWATLHELNRYVKHLPGAADTARQALAAQQRWPQWLWANEETVALAEWLREWNGKQEPANRVGFHGMDVYGPWASADLISTFAQNHLPDAAPRVARKLAPMQAHRDDIGGYVRGHHATEADVMRGFAGLLELVRGVRDGSDVDAAEWFATKQAVHVLKGAHRHFIGMAEQGPQSWNRRAEHMHETAIRLLDRHGPESRGIVWAHNTHIGDARATSMGLRGEVNIGHLARESLGRDAVFALGFATHRGRVIAGRAWESPREEMAMPPGAPGSLEALLNTRFPDGTLLRMDKAPSSARIDNIPHRAIGVVYQPQNEAGNYVPTRPASRYDALLFLPETTALKPLD